MKMKYLTRCLLLAIVWVVLVELQRDTPTISKDFKDISSFAETFTNSASITMDTLTCAVCNVFHGAEGTVGATVHTAFDSIKNITQTLHHCIRVSVAAISKCELAQVDLFSATRAVTADIASGIRITVGFLRNSIKELDAGTHLRKTYRDAVSSCIRAIRYPTDKLVNVFIKFARSLKISIKSSMQLTSRVYHNAIVPSASKIVLGTTGTIMHTVNVIRSDIMWFDNFTTQCTDSILQKTAGFVRDTINIIPSRDIIVNVTQGMMTGMKEEILNTTESIKVAASFESVVQMLDFIFYEPCEKPWYYWIKSTSKCPQFRWKKYTDVVKETCLPYWEVLKVNGQPIWKEFKVYAKIFLEKLKVCCQFLWANFKVYFKIFWETFTNRQIYVDAFNYVIFEPCEHPWYSWFGSSSKCPQYRVTKLWDTFHECFEEARVFIQPYWEDLKVHLLTLWETSKEAAVILTDALVIAMQKFWEVCKVIMQMVIAKLMEFNYPEILTIEFWRQKKPEPVPVFIPWPVWT